MKSQEILKWIMSGNPENKFHAQLSMKGELLCESQAGCKCLRQGFF